MGNKIIQKMVYAAKEMMEFTKDVTIKISWGKKRGCREVHKVLKIKVTTWIIRARCNSVILGVDRLKRVII